MHKPAKVPNDLEKYFVERANAGDVDGLVALYEKNATLVCDDGTVFTGIDQIRKFFVDYLESDVRLQPSDQSPAVCCENLALTSSRHSNGAVSAEIARRQPDGHWLWVVDRFSI